MILALGISIHSTVVNSISGRYEFDNRVWSMIDMKWEMINDTWEEEI
jgi:hypothetical protein